jgi:hypothetical protein
VLSGFWEYLTTPRFTDDTSSTLTCRARQQTSRREPNFSKTSWHSEEVGHIFEGHPAVVVIFGIIVMTMLHRFGFRAHQCSCNVWSWMSVNHGSSPGNEILNQMEPNHVCNCCISDRFNRHYKSFRQKLRQCWQFRWACLRTSTYSPSMLIINARLLHPPLQYPQPALYNYC